MTVRSNSVVDRIERLLLDDPATQSPKIQVLRKALPNTPDTQLRGLLKRSDVRELFDSLSEPHRSTVLVIGDTHAPFTLDSYLDHCESVYMAENCNRVVHIGDVVSNHRSSYHEDETDALSADEELARAKAQLKPWGEAFPDVTVVYGNHDKLIARKAKTGSLSSQWIRPFNEVLGLPWTFCEQIEIDGVLYRHQVGASPLAAANNALKAGKSVVGGHVHTKAGVVHLGKVFGCLTGVGVDRAAYDQRYATSLDPYQISCAVVYEGERAAIFPM